MKRTFILLFLVGLIAVGYMYQSRTPYPELADLTYTLIDGKRLSMQQLRGKPVLVTFWATTCANCIKEIPDLVKLHKEYSGKGFEIIAVAMPYDRPDHVLEFVKARQLPYKIALDIDARVVQAFGNIRVTPNNFLIAPDGRIIRQQIGILDTAYTEKWLKSI